jgi:hypothetical protein
VSRVSSCPAFSSSCARPLRTGSKYGATTRHSTTGRAPTGQVDCCSAMATFLTGPARAALKYLSAHASESHRLRQIPSARKKMDLPQIAAIVPPGAALRSLRLRCGRSHEGRESRQPWLELGLSAIPCDESTS